MLEVLQYVTSGFWVFCGCMCFLSFVGAFLVAIVGAAASFTPIRFKLNSPKTVTKTKPKSDPDILDVESTTH